MYTANRATKCQSKKFVACQYCLSASLLISFLSFFLSSSSSSFYFYLNFFFVPYMIDGTLFVEIYKNHDS